MHKYVLVSKLTSNDDIELSFMKRDSAVVLRAWDKLNDATEWVEDNKTDLNEYEIRAITFFVNYN